MTELVSEPPKRSDTRGMLKDEGEGELGVELDAGASLRLLRVSEELAGDLLPEKEKSTWL